MLNIFHIKFTHIKNQEVLINLLLMLTCTCYLKYYKFMRFKCCESQEKLGQWLHGIVSEGSSEQHDSMKMKKNSIVENIKIYKCNRMNSKRKKEKKAMGLFFGGVVASSILLLVGIHLLCTPRVM